MGDQLILPRGSSEEDLREYAERVGYPFEDLWEAVHGDDGGELLSIVEAFGTSEVFASLGRHDLVEEVTLDGRYRLLRRVGAGSYGTVYEAKDLDFGRKVAVKVMPVGEPELSDREGKALAAIDHPNIVNIFDHGQHADCRWLVLEFLDGPTLEGWGAGKPAREILARYLEAGEGLDAAHGCGLIHRDFKPANVMINAKGRAVVTDFGLARNLESLNDRQPGDGGLIASGTLGFLSRERLQGAPGDERSDQFAFCVSLWSALAGEPPFDASGRLKDYFDSMLERPRGGRKVPRRLRKVLERGLAPIPGERWPTMGRLLEALEGAVARPRWWWGLGVVVALGGAISTWLVVSPDSPLTITVEESEVGEMTLEVLKGIGAHDHDAIVQALSAGYPVARREGREGEFAKISELAAKALEQEKNDFDAEFAWAMTGRLAHQAGDSVLENDAWACVRRLSPHL